MTYTTFSVDIDADGIALLTIDLPDASMNVWNGALIEEFGKWVDDFTTNEAVKGAVITSGKKSGFLAGADLTMLGGAKASSTKEAFDQAFALNALLRKMVREMCSATDSCNMRPFALSARLVVASWLILATAVCVASFDLPGVPWRTRLGELRSDPSPTRRLRRRLLRPKLRTAGVQRLPTVRQRA
jgi:enoyl-CoA hydratase/carnithine racemase